MATVRIFLVVLASMEAVLGHSYHMGKCPTVQPMPDFNMNEFLGRWYTIQKTSARVRCLTNDFSAPRNDPIKMEQTMMFGIPGINHIVRYVGQLSVPDPSQPARMTVKFPLNLAGRASYTVFMTDYKTYAGIYTCQSLALWYRHSASILSRNATLDESIVQQVRSQLKQYGINPQDLDIIRQDCPSPSDDGIHLNIRPNVFKATNITDVLHDANNAINEVSDVAETVYDIYNKFNGVSARRRRDAIEEDINIPEDLLDWLP